MNLIKELEWRGMLQDIMPGTEEQLEKEATTGYIGFDPTSLAPAPIFRNSFEYLRNCP